MTPPRLTLLALCLLLLTARLHAQFSINEFMADNVEDIIDEDGNHEDWIEIYNSSLSAASLQGWYLSDDSGQLRKWAFPAKTLQPGQYLVVFASDKNRKNPAAPLHTNFKLGAGGEFLALSKAEANGGTSIVQSWNPYPAQAADVSYGTMQTGATTSLVGPTSAVKWLVPNATSGPALGATWRGGSEPFNETGWANGAAALGASAAPAIVAEASLQHRFNATTSTLTYDSSGLARGAANSGAAFLASDTDAGTAPLKRTGLMQFVGAENDQVSIAANAAYNAPASTVCFWMRAGPPAGAGNSAAMLWDRRPDYSTAGMVIVQLDDGKIALQSNNAIAALTGSVNVSDDVWHHVAVTMNQGAGQAVTLHVDGQVAGTANNSAAWGWTSGQAIELGRSHDPYWKRFTGLLDDVRFYDRLLTGTEIAQIAQGVDTVMGTSLFNTTGVAAADITTPFSGLSSVNPSAWVRIPFTVADPAALGGVRLTVRFCDGFAAWINGTPVADFNAPAAPLWNSAATSPHDPGRSRVSTLSLPAAAIRAGANILSFQSLNHPGDAADPNVLLRPQLDGLPAAAGPGGYLATPTAGATNSAGLSAIGPRITDTTENPARPVGGAGSPPLTITTKVEATLNAVATVQVAWRVMWGAETFVTMTPAGAGNFTAQIPTTGLAPGGMLRWRIVAKDSAGTATSDPLFIDLDGVAGADTDQYFGTVAMEAGLTTGLPVFHWFVQDPNAAASGTGTRCSVFYRERFYDYLFVNIHGQSTQGFPKKSYNLGFNKNNRFSRAAGEAEIRSVNLLSDYADKSKIRNTLAYESWAASGHAASHFADLLHVRQATGGAPTAAFFGIYDMVEDGNEEFLERCGLDADGALYKMYNSLESTAGGEKKTREFEGVEDLQALINGLDPSRSVAQRRQFVYDNVNVPALINFCAMHSLILNTDWGHKNYYVYRDSLGTKEWFALPWDQDLSFGHTFTGSQGYFDDDIHSQGGLAVGGGGNRLMSLVYLAPDLNAMFVRRMRTLMDQFLVSASATGGPWETRIGELINQIDPPGAAFLTDADRELQKWGYWTDGSSAQQFTGTLDAATHDHGARRQALRILNFNPNPPQTSSPTNANLGNTTFAFLPGRRSFLFTQNPTSGGLGVPPAQPASPALSIEQIDFNPASANQEDEFFVIKNTSGNSVDLSGWKIAGAVRFTFPGGTVLPAYTNGVENIGLLHVAKSPAAFRVRTGGATGGQYRLVAGPYEGSLSARGETLELRRPDGTLLTAQAWAGAPTIAQNQLRVSEINYAPAAPSAAELAAIPGVSASDFEFVELLNTGATTLSLAGARFVKGIEFTFPLGATLAAGTRVVLASNQAAFQFRYGTGLPLGGQYLGNLSNSGETLQLLDAQGEEVLEFFYDPAWFPQSDGGGFSLVARNAAPDWTDYGTPSDPLPALWALSATKGGTPGTGDSDFSNGFEGWRFHFWSLAQTLDPTVPDNAGDDADGDGRTNFVEYCFGGNPLGPDVPALHSPTVVTLGGIQYPGIVFVRRHLAADISWRVEESATLGTWAATAILVGTQNLGGGLEQATYRSSKAQGSAPAFFRVIATK